MHVDIIMIQPLIAILFGILILIYLLMAVEGGTLPHPALFR